MLLSNVVIPANYKECESTFLLLSCLLFLLFTSCVLASYNLYIYSLQPQPQAVCMQHIQAPRKGEPGPSQHTLTEPGSQQHSNCTRRIQSEAKAGTKYQSSPEHEAGCHPGQTLVWSRASSELFCFSSPVSDLELVQVSGIVGMFWP